MKFLTDDKPNLLVSRESEFLEIDSAADKHANITRPPNVPDAIPVCELRCN